MNRSEMGIVESRRQTDAPGAERNVNHTAQLHQGGRRVVLDVRDALRYVLNCQRGFHFTAADGMEREEEKEESGKEQKKGAHT
jgi:hypothetical protein